MNGTAYVGLVDTTRDELRERISLARDRFDYLVRTADPNARPPRSRRTVQQVVAHVLTVAHRYRELARGQEYRRAGTPGEVAVINQAELEAALAPIPELADSIRALAEEMDGYFDQLADDQTMVPFHVGAVVDGTTAQTNWLGELLLHGEDVARAIKAPWEIAERDMLLVARGLMQIAPAFVRAGIAPDTDTRVAINVAGARPYLLHIRGDIAELRERQPGD
ncbi:MAG: hypothetical protein QOG37_1946, partial [Mycobacterium sp.]|nr:hypothetical protein [Mycobacterium sp.]